MLHRFTKPDLGMCYLVSVKKDLDFKQCLHVHCTCIFQCTIEKYDVTVAWLSLPEFEDLNRVLLFLM